MSVNSLRIEKTIRPGQIQQEYNAPCPRYSVEHALCNSGKNPVEEALQVRQTTINRQKNKREKIHQFQEITRKRLTASDEDSITSSTAQRPIIEIVKTAFENSLEEVERRYQFGLRRLQSASDI